MEFFMNEMEQKIKSEINYALGPIRFSEYLVLFSFFLSL